MPARRSIFSAASPSPSGLVLPGAPKSCHIALDCAATHALTGGRWRRTEAETIQGLLGEPGLSPLLSKPR